MSARSAGRRPYSTPNKASRILRPGAVMLLALRGNRRQVDVAAKVGASSRTWCKWESGAVVPNHDARGKLERVFRIPLNAWRTESEVRALAAMREDRPETQAGGSSG